jgi:hypothetical protein|tara:strand:+ start:798 stop:1157 length:360 start_codon:yes stop_codon:yes gene_type:complete
VKIVHDVSTIPSAHAPHRLGHAVTFGARLHLQRLRSHWSVAECAYRLTLEANELIEPDRWLSWERSQAGDRFDQEAHALAPQLARIFGIEEQALFLEEDRTSGNESVIIPMRDNVGQED